MLLINGTPVTWFKFSGGEIQIKLPMIHSEGVTVTWKPTNADDILKLMLVVNALKHDGFDLITLEVLYLPYARQDRVCSSGEAYSHEVICKLIDNLGVKIIKLWDVHNGEGLDDLIENTYWVETEVVDIFVRYKIFEKFDSNNLVLCAPDFGAIDRIHGVLDRFDFGCVYLDKVRDPVSGKITGLSFPGCYDLHKQDVMIIDDICDGGATFLEAASVLKNNNAGNLFLYVTHGIFAKGLDALFEHYKHIYCHHVLDDVKYKSTDRLTILRDESNDAKSIIRY